MEDSGSVDRPSSPSSLREFDVQKARNRLSKGAWISENEVIFVYRKVFGVVAIQSKKGEE